MKSLFEFLINSKSTGIIQDNDFVDLGLSVLWAKCNLGAKEETDYGEFYQWGGLKPKLIDDYNDDPETNTPVYKYSNGSLDFKEEYFDKVKNDVCPNNELSRKYDIANKTYNANNKIHIPTSKQLQELINKTNYGFIKNYDGTNINGTIFENKNDATKYIFIPFAGYIDMRCSISDKNNAFYIWSSTFSDNYDGHAFLLAGDDEKYANNKLYSYPCFNGANIRAVKEK